MKKTRVKITHVDGNYKRDIIVETAKVKSISKEIENCLKNPSIYKVEIPDLNNKSQPICIIPRSVLRGCVVDFYNNYEFLESKINQSNQ